MRQVTITLTMLVFFSIAAYSQKITSYTVGTINWTDVSFADTLIGWICGDTTLMRTTDGGFTWSMVNSLSGSFSCVSACDKNNAFTSWNTIDYNFVGRTSNKSITWDTLLAFCNYCISNIYFSRIKSRDSLCAWIAQGGSPLAGVVNILKTTDAGQTWTYYLPSYGSPLSFTDLSLRPDSAVATLFARKILSRSIDDGAHWRSDTLSKPCNGISIGDRYQFWAVGDSGLVYYSPRYSNPFSEQISGFPENLNAVIAIDTQIVWAVGTNGLISRTTNGGTTWQRILSPTNAELNSICFVDSNHGWIVGDSGIILQIQDGLITSAPPLSTMPRQLDLFQNYPNPFNPSTIISFSLLSRSFVSLKIFDLLGRELVTLVLDELPEGHYTKLWNATNMPSGIYFSRLEVGLFSQTRKLVLLR